MSDNNNDVNAANKGPVPAQRCQQITCNAGKEVKPEVMTPGSRLVSTVFD